MKLRLPVILTPMVPLFLCALLALDDPAALVERASGWSGWVLDHFDWLFNWSIFGCVVVVAIVYFSPLGKQVIGGKDAVPLLSPLALVCRYGLYHGSYRHFVLGELRNLCIT
jgi:glycine betaine transporter